MRDRIETLLAAQSGAVALAQAGEQRGALRAMARAGDLVRQYPGVYVAKGQEQEVATRVQAALLWQPQGVVTGRAAAALTFWPDARVPVVDLLVPHRASSCGDARVWRTVPHADHRCCLGSWDLTVPAWTAVWLARWDDGEALEQALRRRWITVTEMRQALESQHGMDGQPVRRRVVDNSLEQPWSAAERAMHRLLREAGITGWRGNWPVTLGGTTWPVDIAFPSERVAIEVDGFAFHADRSTFDWDHEKQARLQEDGWLVLRVTWTMLNTQPEAVIRRVRLLLESRRSAELAGTFTKARSNRTVA